jgi:hypothetical protein
MEYLMAVCKNDLRGLEVAFKEFSNLGSLCGQILTIDAALTKNSQLEGLYRSFVASSVGKKLRKAIGTKVDESMVDKDKLVTLFAYLCSTLNDLKLGSLLPDVYLGLGTEDLQAKEIFVHDLNRTLQILAGDHLRLRKLASDDPRHGKLVKSAECETTIKAAVAARVVDRLPETIDHILDIAWRNTVQTQMDVSDEQTNRVIVYISGLPCY